MKDAREDKLGALELCSALNGDDPILALRYLRKFTETVRRERLFSLFGVTRSSPSSERKISDDQQPEEEEDEESEEDEDEEESTIRKKRKVEEDWKKDTDATAEWNVPFVGTSILKGDCGTVVPGQWPTGLLSAYFRSSPMGVELTGDSFIPPSGIMHKFLARSGRSKKVSVDLYVAYLLAVAEVVTAFIPVIVLKKRMILLEGLSASTSVDDSAQTCDTEFASSRAIVSCIMKERFPSILKLINVDRGRGHDKSLINAAFCLLSYLSCTSTGTATEIARNLGSLNNDALVLALRQYTFTASKKEEKEKDKSKLISKQKQDLSLSIRCGFLQLAASLIESNDSLCLSMVMKQGSKERKVTPGIVFLALRDGMPDRALCENEDKGTRAYFHSVAYLLFVIRETLLPIVGENDNDKGDRNFRIGINNRAKTDLLGSKALECLTRLSFYAPPLPPTEKSFSSVLNCTDASFTSSHNPPLALELAAMEARRLLFLLVASSTRSPFYIHLLHPNRNENVAAFQYQQLSRTLWNTYTNTPNSQTRSFVLHCLNITPELLPYFFRIVQIPDTGTNFRFVTMLDFSVSVMRHGPTVQSCLSRHSKLHRLNAEYCLSCVMPLSFNKAALGKAVLHSNAFIVLQSLTLIAALLERSASLLEVLENGENDLGGLSIASFRDSLRRRLPDLQALLAVRSKYSPFQKDVGDAKVPSKNNLVSFQLLQVLRLYRINLPGDIDSARFDWLKLFGDSHEAFLSVIPALQVRILSTLLEFADQIRFNTKFLTGLLTIAQKSNIPRVVSLAQELARLSILQRAPRSSLSAETRYCHEYEASLWVNDAQAEQLIGDVGKLFDRAPKHEVGHVILVARAWEKVFGMTSTRGEKNQTMGEICFSPMLGSAISMVAESSSSTSPASSDVVALVCRVAMRTLLFHIDPLPLAAFILHQLTDKVSDNSSPLMQLCQYARVIVDSIMDEHTEILTSRVIHDNTLFSSKNDFTHAISNLVTKSNDDDDVKRNGDAMHSARVALDNTEDGVAIIAIIRQCAHHLVMTERSSKINSTTATTNLHSLLRSAFVKAFLCTEDDLKASALHAIFRHDFLRESLESKVLLLLTLSSPEIQSHEKRIKSATNNFTNLVIQNFESFFSREESAQNGNLYEPNTLLFGTLVDILPPSYTFPVLASLFECCDALSPKHHHTEKHHLCRTLLLCLTKSPSPATTTITTTHNNGDARLLARPVIKLWTALIKLNEKQIIDNVDAPLCLKLEEIMINFLTNSERDGVGAASLVAQAMEISPKIILQCLLVPRHKTRFTDSNESLLTAFLRYDCYVFGKELVEFLGGLAIEDTLDAFWTTHKLDGLFVTLVKEARRQKCESLFDLDHFSTLTTRFVKETTSMIAKEVRFRTSSNDEGRLLQVSSLAICDLIRLSRVRQEEHLAMTLELSSLTKSLIDKSVKRPSIQTESAVISVSLALLDHEENTDSPENDSTSVLCSRLFIWLCIGLFKAFRFKHKQKKEANQTEHCPLAMLEQLIVLISKDRPFNEELITAASSKVRTAVLVCLKYGLADGGEGDGDTQTGVTCLQFLRLLLTKVSTPTPLAVLSSIDVLDSAQMHTMIVSHSRFGLVIASSKDDDSGKSPAEDDKRQLSRYATPDVAVVEKGDEGHDEGLKLALLRLLVCCASLGLGQMNIDQDTLATVLAGYNAGIDAADRSIRRLLHLYEESAMALGEDGLCYLDELRWGPSQSISKQKIENEQGKHWEWFLNCMDMRRVRSTLIQFPAWEELTPPADAHVEVWASNKDTTEPDAEAMTDLDNLDVEDDPEKADQQDPTVDGVEDDTASTGLVRTAPHSSLDENKVIFHGDKWRGNGPDNRYCPSFMLPLIFGVLQSFLPPDGTTRYKKVYEKGEIDRKREWGRNDVEPDDSNTDYAQIAHREAFAQVSYRLSESGALALTLACLSAKSPALRQLACCTLDLFSQAINSEEAHNLTIWRARPQLSMIIDSVRRGLALWRARLLAKNSGNNTDKDEKESVLLTPMLPVVSAIFLARATLVAVKSADAMFEAINRYFLSIDDHHGAFKDFSGIPGFMALFCSNSEPSQAQKERLWALQLLRDGVLDGHSYHIAFRRHVPSLLLTSFDSLSRRTDQIANPIELVKLVETIEILLRSGGKVSYFHLINKVGLLSWIRGILVGGCFYSSRQTLSLRVSLMRLLITSIDVAHTMEDTTEKRTRHLLDEAVSLAKPVTELFADTIHKKLSEKDTGNQHQHQYPFRSIFCDALWSLRSIVHGSSENHLTGAHTQEFSYQGINLETACALLGEFESSQPTYVKILGALTSFPFCVDEKDASFALEFSRSCLLGILEADTDESAFIIPGVLRRVSALCSRFSIAKDDEDLATLLLKSWNKCICCPDGRKEWLGCISQMTRGTYSLEKKHGCTAVEVVGHVHYCMSKYSSDKSTILEDTNMEY